MAFVVIPEFQVKPGCMEAFLAAALDDASQNRNAQFLYQGQVVMEKPMMEFLWDFMFDAIHHRGQLSAYLRPMGGKVPSIYGPSADDTGM